MTARRVGEVMAGTEPAQPTHPTQPAQRGTLGPYRLVHQLGEGGMGVVHLGIDRQGRAVAIKVLRPHIAYDAGARARLEREVDTLSRVRDRRVAAVIDADIHGERPYIVTRYVPGPSLEEVVAEHGVLRGDELLLVGRGLASALHAIHAVGVVHRDLKPGNVLLDEGEPVVIDFGIAHVADDVRLTSAGLVMGTPGYLSPEVIEGARVTEATDWWGWAATLTFAASGHPPFGRGPMDVVLDRVRRGQADLSQVHPRLAPLLSAALSPRPEQRPPPGEVVAALERYAGGEPATTVLPLSSGWGDGGAGDWDDGEPGWEATGRHTSVLPQGAGADAGYELVPDESDLEEPGWEAGWDAGPEEGDPRIGRPMRTGMLAAMALFVVALAASRPGLAVVALLGWSWVARFADRSVTTLVLRRHERGHRRSDVPLVVALGPWHVVTGAAATLASMLLPALVAVGGVFSTALAISSVTGAAPAPMSPPTVAVGFLLGTLVAWWGPGGASLRRGSRSLVRGLAPPGVASDVVLAVLLVGAAGLVVWEVLRPGGPSWWPLTGIPTGWLGGRGSQVLPG